MADHPFTNLVFEGGGVKGVAYVGALQVLEERGVRSRIGAVAGTSAGAITAALVAAGYSAVELKTAMMALDLRSFEDGRLEGPVRILEKYGWYKGDAFLAWLHARIADKLGSADATFADLQQATQVDLRVVATDLSTHRPVTFGPASTPHVAVATAVRMSMSIPLFFAAVSWGGNIYVDGGAVWNFPIEMFDGPGGANPATLGLHLGLMGKAPPPHVPIADLVEYGKALYETITRVQSDDFERSAPDVARSVFIDDLGLKATDFDITQEQKLALIDQGVKATAAYLNQVGG
jgi:NTE family protein